MKNKKIFIACGSQKFQFNRLLKKIDELVESGYINGNNVVAQIGYSDYRPKHFEYYEFINQDEFKAYLNESDLIITHGGTGVIISSKKLNKKVIAIPRLSKYGEHVDDHQLQIIEAFSNKGIIESCSDIEDLYRTISIVFEKEYVPYESNNSAFVDDVINYIEGLNI